MKKRCIKFLNITRHEKKLILKSLESHFKLRKFKNKRKIHLHILTVQQSSSASNMLIKSNLKFCLDTSKLFSLILWKESDWNGKWERESETKEKEEEKREERMHEDKVTIKKKEERERERVNVNKDEIK